jgi:hypothetical protein
MDLLGSIQNVYESDRQLVDLPVASFLLSLPIHEALAIQGFHRVLTRNRRDCMSRDKTAPFVG